MSSRHRTVRAVGTLLLSLLAAGCSVLAPLPEETSLEQRLDAIPTENLPLRGKVTIHWDEHQIPFIEAAHDEDAAFALGLVHAHLRLGQMEIYRHISQGRIAEAVGPLATDIDHGLRILNFGRAAEEIEAALPEKTRAWLEAYVAGINHYQQTVAKLPLEFAVLGLEREPWTIKDVITFGRLTGTDVNWLVWFDALELRQRDDWPRIWTRLIESGSDSVPSFDGDGDIALLDEILAGLSRSGSNSLAIAPGRTKTGAAILANDPHLGIRLPNTWLVVGLKSPSYHAVGLMVPGLPIFAIGRNPWIAWGGTNMRAAASVLYDVSGLPPEEITERQETIKVRWWFDEEITVRETKWGPILSDAPQFQDLKLPDFALKWTGYSVSDEITAMLKVSRARDFQEFRGAFETFAVPGQNMLYADNSGNIGQMMAVRLPSRTGPPPPDIILDPEDREAAWQVMQGALDLPFTLNPEKGFLASANNRPAETKIQIGYFFSPDDRVVRMADIVKGKGAVGIEEVKRLQQDVYMPSAAALRDLWVRKLEETGIASEAAGKEREMIDLLRGWDGFYRSGSRGAVAFELFRVGFTPAFYEPALGEEDWETFTDAARIKSLMLEDIEAATPERLVPALKRGLEEGAEHIDDFADWGEMHRLGLSHPLALLPLIGDKYQFANYAIGGSTDTIMKTAHDATDERHVTRYGSNARHISDLSGVDRNYFALLGGQDGWINSSTFMDQVPLWLEGDYVEMPLTLDKVRERFARKMELGPESP